MADVATFTHLTTVFKPTNGNMFVTANVRERILLTAVKSTPPPHPSLPLPSPRSLPPLPSLPPLLSLPSHSPSLRPHNSEAISDEVTVYKFNKEKAVLWLRAKVEAQASTLEKNKVYVGTGSQSSMLVRSNKRSDHTRG